MTPQELFELRQARALAKSGTARAIRLAAGHSGVEIAGAVGITPSALSRWEAGERTPRGEPALRWFRLMEELTPRRGATAKSAAK